MPNINTADLANVAGALEATLGPDAGHYSLKAVVSVDTDHPYNRIHYAVAEYPTDRHFVVVRTNRTGNVVIGDPLPTMGQALGTIAAAVDAVPDTAEAEPDPILDAA